ncbi:hypothetical protein ABZ499_07020 [Streptomyces sp. NPDC019990]|uniref:hypothetical protein n=1 Tax=Streptomyces sp. NPDC019990 TaxID=3154693 RepID=UPI0033DE86FB
MGIRTLLRRPAPRVALPPVPVFAAAASTLRVPVTPTAALRRTGEGLRQRLTAGRRPAGPTGSTHESATPALRVTGPLTLPVTGPTDGAGISGPGGRSIRPWAGLARGYLTLILALRPRPRSTDTITVVIVRTTSPVSERPDGSAPRHRRVQDRPGPAPDATP